MQLAFIQERLLKWTLTDREILIYTTLPIYFVQIYAQFYKKGNYFFWLKMWRYKTQTEFTFIAYSLHVLTNYDWKKQVVNAYW